MRTLAVVSMTSEPADIADDLDDDDDENSAPPDDIVSSAKADRPTLCTQRQEALHIYRES